MMYKRCLKKNCWKLKKWFCVFWSKKCNFLMKNNRKNFHWVRKKCIIILKKIRFSGIFMMNIWSENPQKSLINLIQEEKLSFVLVFLFDFTWKSLQQYRAIQQLLLAVVVCYIPAKVLRVNHRHYRRQSALLQFVLHVPKHRHRAL